MLGPLCIVAACALALSASRAWALPHPGVATTATFKIEPDGRVVVRVTHDALAFALNDTSLRIADAPMYEFLDAGERVQTPLFDAARERFVSLTEIRAGVEGKRVEVRVIEFPSAAAVWEWRKNHPDRRLPVKMEIIAEGQLPVGARTVSFHFPEVLGDVIATIDRPGAEPLTFPLAPGEMTPEIEWKVENATSGGEPGAAKVSGASTGDHSPGTVNILWRYIRLGFTHIIPEGTDHALFVLGLFLLTPRVKALVWQITAFTIAHSVTLALTTFHILSIPSVVIEPTIALTIAFIGVENIIAKKVYPWRTAVAFCFGLVHGMGFATALGEVGLPTGQLVMGLVGFNIGVECGHLFTLAAAFALLGWCRNKPWYRGRVAMPLSMVIACIALFWMVERIAFRE